MANAPKSKQKTTAKPAGKPAAEAATVTIQPLLFWQLIVFAFSFLLYANTLGHNYTLDDVAVIQQNKFVQQGIGGIPPIFTTFYWQGFWDLNSGLYRPLSLILFAITQQLFPDNPFAGHLINALLYAGCVVLLLRLLLRLFGNAQALLALVATLVFAAHPLHTEVVANIKSADELLALLFLLLSSIALLKYAETPAQANMVVALLTYFLALLSKEASLVFIGVFVLMLYYKGETKIKRYAILLSPFIIMAVLYVAWHEWVIAHAPTARIKYSYLDNALTAAPGIFSRIATAIMIMGKYLYLLVIPHPLSYDYSFNQIQPTTFADWRVLLSLAAYIAMVVFAVRGLKQKTIPAFGISFFLITIVLTSNIFFLIGSTMAERFLFTPSIGFSLLLAWLAIKHLKPAATTLAEPAKMFSANKTVFAVIGLLLLLYSFKTVSRNSHWKDNFTLFVKDAGTSPNSYTVQYNYGTAMLNHYYQNETDSTKKQQYLGEAVTALKRAGEIDTNSANAFINLSIAYYKGGNYNDARNAAIRAVKNNPNDVLGYINLGNALFRLNQFDAALEAYNKATSMGGGSEDVYRFMGGCYFAKQDYPGALNAFGEVLKINPNNFEAHLNTGSANAILNNFDKALQSFRTANQLMPGNPQVYFYMGNAFNGLGMSDSAGYYMRLAGR